MQAVLAVVVGLMLSAPVVAEPFVEGWVRRSSGEPVEAAQVLVFDWTDLRRGAVAQATTDAAGYFALPLKSLGGSALPQAWTLGQNYPNPFNPSTLIPYQVPTAALVRLEVFNVLGQRVATLVDGDRPAGVHTAVWDATDAAGRAVGAGVYFYRLSSAGQPTLTRRMVLLDGQAGQPAASAGRPQAQATASSAERVYGLSVTGAGLVTYVDASFGVRSGMAAVEVVVGAVGGLPRGKALTGGVLGDVNGDGQVTLDDALLVTTYVVNGSVELPPNGDISLGDVNGDGQVTIEDAQLLTAYVANPADGSLPAGIGQAVPSSGGDWVAGDIRRLTTDGGWHPSWSPNGRHIAFISGRDDDFGLYVMGSDGTNLRRLTTEDGWHPSWSPNGRYIAFTLRGFAGIRVIRSDGSNPLLFANDFNGFPSWSPDGRHIAFVSWHDGNAEIYVIGSDGSNRRRLTHHSAWDGSPSWSPDGRHIAFTSGRDSNAWDYVIEEDDGAAPFGSNAEIYVMGSDGSNPRRLTHHSATDQSPSWSPDGRHIAFTSERDGNAEIYVMDSDGSNPRRLTHHSAWDGSPSWSPDGRHIAFTSGRDGYREIYVIELREEGSDGTPLDDGDSPATAIPLAVGEFIEGELSAGDSDYFRVTVSNAGTLVASTSGSTDTYGSIEDSSGNVLNENDEGGEGHNFRVSAVVEPGTYYIRVRGFDASSTGAYTLTLQMEEGSAGGGGDWVAGAIRRLTNNSAGDYDPSWSPDGRYIAFMSNRDGDFGLYMMGSDGSNPRHLTHGFLDPDYDPSWSPDGRYIAFTLSGFAGIRVVGSDGSNPLLFANDYNYSPSWSPDGRHIAFVSWRDGNPEIYVMGSDGSNPRNLTHHSAWDGSPSWSPDGRHIAFTSGRDSNAWGYAIEEDGSLSSGDSEIYVMDSDGSNPRRLTHHSAWDFSPTWSPDGRHIAFTSDRDGDREIYVMDSDGSNPRRLTHHSAWDGSPSWSPDGRHIAFDSDRDGNWEIYVMELRQEDSGETSLDDGDNGDAFDIELVFLNDNDFTSSQRALLQQGAAHWMSIITGDIEDVDFSDNPFDEWDSTLNARIRVNDTVDDLRLFVRAVAIDGPYNTGGQGGHWMILGGESHLLPKIGTIVIDTADLQRLEEEGALLGTFLHEIGHALGITEIMRQELDLLRGNNDRYFTGPLATQAFNNAGGRNYNGIKVPTERDGAHWRKSVFGDELMSPSYYSSDNRPLSTVTIQSLADIGYRVDVTQADAYRVPEPASAKLASDHVPVGEDCILNGPIYVVEENGRIIRVIGE